MRADEYVVDELLKLKAENDRLKETNHFLREDIRELENNLNIIRPLFKCERVGNVGCSYAIQFYDIDGVYKGFAALTLDATDIRYIEPSFIKLLNALGLTLPVNEPSEQELENDQELVNEALEKAKELQKND